MRVSKIGAALAAFSTCAAAAAIPALKTSTTSNDVVRSDDTSTSLSTDSAGPLQRRGFRLGGLGKIIGGLAKIAADEKTIKASLELTKIGYKVGDKLVEEDGLYYPIKKCPNNCWKMVDGGIPYEVATGVVTAECGTGCD